MAGKVGQLGVKSHAALGLLNRGAVSGMELSQRHRVVSADILRPLDHVPVVDACSLCGAAEAPVRMLFTLRGRLGSPYRRVRALISDQVPFVRQR